ncbi:MAG: mevalonate kinase [Candidatus Aenigmarchaeota archaeon]|nr:mevalonate kinase [Candidatus Aenigmarchaeota archaeon]
MVTVSAPGKLMFFGEHAAVYGVPCIALAINQRLYCTVKKRQDGKIIFNFPDLELKNYEYRPGSNDRRVCFIARAILNTLGDPYSHGGFEVETRSEMKKGVGTSSGCVVSLIVALNELFKLNLSKEQMFHIAYKTVLDVQGKGSGYDVATSLYGGFIKYLKGQIPQELGCPRDLLLVMGHTNIKADTVELIDRVAKKKDHYPHFFNEVLWLTKQCVDEAEISLENDDLEGIADMMNFVHGLLNGMGVSHPKLEELIFASRKAGALGAKLSGAGGGDCMIALVTPETKDSVMSAIKEHGGIPLEIKVSEGARVESCD